MKLVIAEKPSVAMSLAAVLGATERKDGYLEGSGYLVSWCVGHLLELAQPEAYKEQYAKWRYEDLPILPENWKYEVPKDKKTQLALLCRLMKDKRVDSVVCATDAGREGELIFRLVYEYAGCKKPMERLWISSMEDAAIREGFDRLRPGSDYDKLYDAAVCRAGADWLIGINATRLFSVLYGVTLNVGRVMSPTLALLVQRESDIESFISKPFYVPEITCGGFTASGEKMTERSEAEKIRMDCDHNSAFVRSVEKQVKTIQPPRLYDLTTLQRECNRIYGYTAQQTLDYVQSLYEKKLATYPRTDSQYLTKDMQATAASLILWLRDNMTFGKGYAGEPDIDRVTDDSKVTDHHAIIPTVEIARTDLSELPSGERDVLTLLAVRLLCATTQVHRFEAVTAILDCQGYTFTAKGKTILQSGWKEVERIHRMSIRQSETEHKENEAVALPVLQEGQTFEAVSASLREGKTSPPKHYTAVSYTHLYLFHRSPWKESITFKGGTSLSKAFHLISRFSEDIDLILDWRVLGYGKDEPWEKRSNTKQDAFNKEANARAEVFLSETFCPAVKAGLSQEIGCEANVYIDEKDKQTVIFAYPHLFTNTATLQVIRLEIGRCV